LHDHNIQRPESFKFNSIQRMPTYFQDQSA